MPKTKPTIVYIPCESSQISQFGYDDKTRTLGIKFKGAGGSTYHYFEVPPDLPETMKTAPSIGKFFGANVKGKFLFERQPDEPGGVAFGLKLEQSGKYTVNKDGRICVRATGRAIPDDEPIFILRARDLHAAGVIGDYYQMCGDTEHSESACAAFVKFSEWADAHPERMKEPDTKAAAPVAA